VGLELDIGLEDISRGLKDLGGLARRFHVKGEKKGVLVIDDYGHHPTEIVATLETARECWPERRLVVVFQPHRYSRTKLLFDRFVISFNDADSLILAPIYPAGERPIEGVSSEGLFQGIKEHGHKDVVLCSTPQEILAHLSQKITKGDVVITLGAGDIYHIGESLLEKLSR
ncbi:MAG: UDP-N-acetylmuramate--L-alanine ligase, partial [Deltaproteobacteria bacterium]|nr:UDP-N-acetylmuramate--L-alanine ligase [Deltaproteobacteria bacterium]